MKNLGKAILLGGAALLTGNIIYNKGRNDGIDACKNAVYKTVAEEAWRKEEKESKKKKVESE